MGTDRPEPIVTPSATLPTLRPVMQRLTILAVICAVSCTALAGCGKTLHTNSTAKVTTITPPVIDGGPVVEMPIPGFKGDAARVAIVDVDGLLLNMDMTGLYSLGENPVALFRERLERAASDPCIRAVVVRINSRGGGVTASDIMWHDLQQFKAQTGKPVVACLMDIGTGGAYLLATSADHIIAHPTTITGGIGVILNLYNLEDALAYFSVAATPIKAGENIDMGTPIRVIDEEQRVLLQQMANEFHARFRDLVLQSRPIAPANEDTDFDGRIFTATQALDRRLIDQIGYLDNAIQLARDLSGSPRATVVLLHRCNDRGRSPYAITPNVPAQGSLFPLSVPGLDRSRLPTFLCLWQVDPTLERMGGR